MRPTRTGIYSHAFGLDPHDTRLSFETYLKLDPVIAAGAFAEIDEPVSVEDVISYDEYLRTPFHREWAEPQGLVDFLSCLVEKSASGATYLCVPRHERDGLVGGEARQRMRLITPHIRRALSIGRVVDRDHAQAAMFVDTLDGLSTAVFLMAENGRIVHANVAARAILATNDFLYAARDRLVARDAAGNRSLQSLLLAAVNGHATIGVGGRAVPLTAPDRECYVAHLLPLTSDTRRRPDVARGAVAALFVHKASVDTPSLPENVSRHYKLTPTERRVLLGIVEVGGGAEVAQALGVANSTIKTHLHRLYQKTGARGQTDLVKLVAGFSSPFLA